MRSALAFAEAGIPIFPVRLFRQGERLRKEPYIKQWLSRATTDPRIIEGWWRQFPNAAVGIPLARCGLVVVDADRHPGKPDGVAALVELGDLPPHPIVRTAGGGEHHYFAQTDPPIASNDAFADRGIDVLGTSRFVVGYDLAPLFEIEPPPLADVFRAKTRLKAKSSITETPRCVWDVREGVRPALVSRNSREGRYAWAALQNAFAKLAHWPKKKDDKGVLRRVPGRNNMLNKLAFKMGGLVANGWIAEALVVKVLMRAAAECGLVREDGEAQCLATISSGLQAGLLVPYPQLEPPNPHPILYPQSPHNPGGL